MKGLLLKDFYMIVKYCRSYLLMAIVFLTVSVLNPGNTFFVFYPVLLAGMIPTTLLSYDERSGWQPYSAALPYTKAQCVSAKYLVGLICQGAILVLLTVVQGICMSMTGTFDIAELLTLVLMLSIIAPIAPAFCMPFIFKLGVEKGRIAYYVMIAIICALVVGGSTIFSSALDAKIEPGPAAVFVVLLFVALYALSWFLSIKFYEKREL
ncbi:MAG: ABC-2 transporter permease [Lachnospiraceae bacterium]|nr:ABC-2 transporter permease [Lachnospiraceae bacterium]